MCLGVNDGLFLCYDVIRTNDLDRAGSIFFGALGQSRKKPPLTPDIYVHITIYKLTFTYKNYKVKILASILSLIYL
jgi:hypothetical protein